MRSNLFLRLIEQEPRPGQAQFPSVTSIAISGPVKGGGLVVGFLFQMNSPLEGMGSPVRQVVVPVKGDMPVNGFLNLGELIGARDFNPQGVQMVGGIMMNLPEELPIPKGDEELGEIKILLRRIFQTLGPAVFWWASFSSRAQRN